MNGRTACAAPSSGDLERERKIERAYDALRKSTLEAAANLAARGKMSDLEKLRDKVRAEDQRLGGQRAGDVAALLATIDLEAAAAIEFREANKVWQRRAPAYRRYRRAMNNSLQDLQRRRRPAREGQGDERAADHHHHAAGEAAGALEQDGCESRGARGSGVRRTR